MKTEFIISFDKILKNSAYIENDISSDLLDKFNYKREENTEYLYIELKKSKLSNGYEYFGSFYNIIGLITELGKNKKFSDVKIIELLKEEINFQLGLDKPKNLSFILYALFSINKNENEYYSELYLKIVKKSKNFNDINATFLSIFIEIKNNYYFLKTFKKIIIDNVHHFYSSNIKNGLKYLNSLKQNNFKKILLELLNYFNDEKIKSKLIKHHEYSGIFSEKYGNNNEKEINSLFENIEKYNFNELEIKELYNFLYSDIQFALKKYQRNLGKILFLNKLINYLYKKNKKIILQILENIDLNKHIFGIEEYIVKYLKLNDIDNFLKLLKGKKYEAVIFYTYDYLKKDEKIKFVEKFEQSKIFGKQILERNKKIEKNNKKFEARRKKENEKEKKEFLKMLNPKKGTFWPKLFEKYLDYEEEEKKLKNIFSKKEINEIEKDLKKQIYTCLDYVKIESYTKKNLEIIHFEKTGDSTYTHSAYSEYLELIIRISKILKINLEKYYKTIVLFYPLLWGYEKLEYINKIIGNKLDEKDIDYILKVYSKDLHKKAIGLRFNHIQNLIDFYKDFREKFNEKQKRKLEKICLEFFNIDEGINIYEKESFLKIYVEIGGEIKFRKLWNTWNKKYPNFNFFHNILINKERLDKKEIDNYKFLVYLNKILILKFQNKKDVLWRIKQILNGKIEGEESLKIEYPNTTSSANYIDPVDSEIGQWGNDERNFSYIFRKIPNINIKKEILELLKLSFNIQKNLLSGKLEGKYDLYYNYLRRIFFDYILNLDESLIEKSFYYSIKNILSKYDYKITYNFNLEKLREKFGIDDLEEEAKEIYEKGTEGIKDLLEKKCKLENKNFNIEKSISGKIDINKILNDNTKLKQENKKLKKYRKDYSDIYEKNRELIEKNNTLRNNNKEFINKNKKLKEEIDALKETNKIIDKKCILFVEGESDKKYLDYYYNSNFCKYNNKPQIIVAGSSRQVLQILKEYENIKINIPIVGLFDFDGAGYSEFINLKDLDYLKIEDDYHKGKLRKHIEKNIYGMLLPVPNNKIKHQVIYNEEKIEKEKIQTLIKKDLQNFEKKDFGLDSKLVIEHLLYGLNKINNKHKEKIENELFNKNTKTVGGGKYIEMKKKNNKVNFATKLLNGDFLGNNALYNNGELFENFMPIFEAINKIIINNHPGKPQ